VAIGYNSETYAQANNSVAIGPSAIVGYKASNSIQLGAGTCTESRTLQFCATKIAQGTTSTDIKILPDALPAATANQIGAVKPDGTSIQVDGNGVISAKPLAGNSEYDFSTTDGFRAAVRDVVQALGGTVVDF
jgi:hypothetical protein